MNFNDWDTGLREILQSENSPLSLDAGRYWEVNNKFESLALIKDRIFDKHLELIKNICIEVLKEVDPKFDLNPDNHYMAPFYGKKMRYSNMLREGLSETLVWLGINGDMLKNCSADKRKYISRITIREIFSDASWQLWGSLNYLLPTLSEADPDEFLDSVESALHKKVTPFDELFRQESDGITGGNYLTGLYWALEVLAWNENYLARVCVILAELAEHDPGGKWTNRPSNSIVDILLPWHAQTLATIDKRVAAMRAIRKDSPLVAWKVLLSLLPNSHQTTSGTHKPKWRNALPEDWAPDVTNDEYWDQVKSYAEIIVDMAMEDMSRVKELVGNMDNLPQPSFDVFLSYLGSDSILRLEEVDRTPIWEKLIEFANKHRRFSNAKWALPEDIVARIEDVAQILQPMNTLYFTERLFSNRDFDLYDENGNWEEQRKKLAQKRREAVERILGEGGLVSIINFIENVESPNNVGMALGEVGSADIDGELLPGFIGSDSTTKDRFIGSYMWGRFYTEGWGWVDGLNKSNWSQKQLCKLLEILPFNKETWKRVEEWLGDNEGIYWEVANINLYQAEDDLLFVIDKLLEYSRPVAAIDCLYYLIHGNHPLDIDRAIAVLTQALSSNEENHRFDSLHVEDVIAALQNNSTTPVDDMCQIEWRYLPLLRLPGEARPKCLHKKLSTDPSFFCEIVSLVYRSKDDKNEGIEPDEVKREIATNAWHLLHDWKIPPGVQDDGTFSEEEFSQWFHSIKEHCEQAGRYDIALLEVGKILFYIPADPDGFWINKTILPYLDERTAEDLRDGFRSEIFNSRGVHWVDPTGKPEMQLAELWKQKANEVENEACPRFAAVLKEVALSYERDAERIIREHERRNKE